MIHELFQSYLNYVVVTGPNLADFNYFCIAIGWAITIMAFCFIKFGRVLDEVEFFALVFCCSLVSLFLGYFWIATMPALLPVAIAYFIFKAYDEWF